MQAEILEGAGENGVHHPTVDEVLLNMRNIRLARELSEEDVARNVVRETGDLQFTGTFYGNLETGDIEMSLGDFLKASCGLGVHSRRLLDVDAIEWIDQVPEEQPAQLAMALPLNAA